MSDIDKALLASWSEILGIIAKLNYSLMEVLNSYLYIFIFSIIFIASLIKLSPLKTHHEHSFLQMTAIAIRRLILWFVLATTVIVIGNFFAYTFTSISTPTNMLAAYWWKWFATISIDAAPYLVFAFVAAKAIRLICFRYGSPALSAFAKKLRNNQSKEKLSDIRSEHGRYKPIDFVPSKHYKKGFMLVGINPQKKPIRVPISTWLETNMQVIGPTRYGKGVILGGIMDQTIINGDGLFYIDPKRDKFAPHIMYQQALKQGRKFYYLTLHDDGIGKWSPFSGGSKRDALARIEQAFGLELTGQAGTDFYKTQEKRELFAAFDRSQTIEGLYNQLEGSDSALRTIAELERWSAIKSLNPKKGKGFSIENALKENAVVYVQGDLNDNTVKDATKIFISELIQEIRRLDKARSNHVTVVIDEVSFLASQTLTQALATILGFRANFVLAYQSQKDLLNLDDKSVNAEYVYQSINVNSQIKAVYGGADFDTAKWLADTSGTINKNVTKFESTDVSATGGETWQQHRMLGDQEENLITANTILTLEPRVCAFIQPRHLTEICCTSFVPVKSFDDLETYLERKQRVYTHTNETKNNDTKDSVEAPDESFTNKPEPKPEPKPESKPEPQPESKPSSKTERNRKRREKQKTKKIEGKNEGVAAPDFSSFNINSDKEKKKSDSEMMNDLDDI